MKPEKDTSERPATQTGESRSKAGPDVPRWVYGRWAEAVRPPNGSAGYPGEVSGQGYLFKRTIDIFLSGIGLMIASPLWLIFSVAIKLEDRGPILFIQERWGKNGGTIRVFKFRTMVPNAVERFGHIQAQENDPRVTKVGRLLRATSLDEMP